VPLRGRAVSSSIGLVQPLVPELPETVHCVVDYKKHVSTTATVPSIGTATRYILLPPETDEPMPTITGFDTNAGGIDQWVWFLTGISMISIERGIRGNCWF